ncbi:nuclear transport factor 2 family protein [Stakelama saccharophila]|uniref:Nuclear transport factor 2 family protein n=1 Tax=Stakelama saccharophila TaxID=3075605 RepID=A0ABZ0B6S6_9SPHN|nr:nuclear transport factor 2 family protein [Stakelama sp. W311]WNO52917.1 nuclear transport factor 2 family protein [Stakelama sp. W311]
MPPILLLLAAQATPVPPLPPADPGPPPTPEVANVLAPINAMFAGLAAHDASAIRARLLPEGGATVAVEQPDGTRTIRHMGWDEFLAGIKPGDQRLEERLINPAVEVDGDIAMVWGPYVFTVDGAVSHCGVDHFDLVRKDGAWKVLNVTWSQRETGCPGQ